MQLQFYVNFIVFCVSISQCKDRQASLVVLPPLILGYDELYADATEREDQVQQRNPDQETTIDVNAKENLKADTQVRNLNPHKQSDNKEEIRDAQNTYSRDKMRNRVIAKENLSSSTKNLNYHEHAFSDRWKERTRNYVNENKHVNSQNNNHKDYNHSSEEKRTNYGKENENLSAYSKDRNYNGQQQTYSDERLRNHFNEKEYLKATTQDRNYNAHQLFRERFSNHGKEGHRHPNRGAKIKNHRIQNENLNAKSKGIYYNTQKYSYRDERRIKDQTESILETLSSLERYMPDMRRFLQFNRRRYY